MAIYIDQMFNTAGESTTLAAMNKGTTTSTDAYRAKKGGRLLKVILLSGYEAATSLVEDIRVHIGGSVRIPDGQIEDDFEEAQIPDELDTRSHPVLKGERLVAVADFDGENPGRPSDHCPWIDLD